MSPSTEPQSQYAFGDLLLDNGQRRVWRSGKSLELTRRPFALLRLLVEASPNVVTHDEIASKVWGPNRIVTPENIAQHIRMLRRALGDDAAHARYIEVVRGVGYRLVPRVRVQAEIAAEPQVNSGRTVRWAYLGLTGVGVVVLTALMLARPWADPSAGHIADPRPLPSVADELVRALAHGGEGNAELASLWSANQDRVSGDDLTAYDLYLEGITWTGRPDAGSNDQALALFERAVELEPDFAHAYTMIAWVLARSQLHTTYHTSRFEQRSTETEERVAENTQRALSLDSGLGRAYIPLADLYESAWRWDDALVAYQIAEALAPQDPLVLYRYSWFNSFAGYHARAIELARRAIDVQPEYAQGWLDLGMAQMYAGDQEEAADALYRASALEPGNLVVRLLLGLTEAVRGNEAAAEVQLRSVERLLGDSRPLAYLPKLAIAYALLDRHEDAARIVTEIEARWNARELGAGTLALAHLSIGDRDGTRRWLELAAEGVRRNERDPGYYSLVSLKHNIFEHPMLEEPEFQRLRKQLGGFVDAAASMQDATLAARRSSSAASTPSRHE